MAPLLRFALLGTLALAFAGCESPATGSGGASGVAGDAAHPPAWVALERSGNSGLIYRVTLFEGGAVLFGPGSEYAM